ncbi:hypothetical protein LTR17_000321 [Elasticomyces elasticus]|nr:hypothetical protein LTR17_000321 [Elasticomyces elasticus]
MAPKAYILELPTEMLVQIADELKGGHDLLSLRLTCSSLEHAANDAFAAKYFAIRTHLFTRHGLQTLAKIAKHPYLGRRVQKVEFIVKELCDTLFGPYDYAGGIPPVPQHAPTEAQKLRTRENIVRRKQGWANWQPEMHALSDESQVSAMLNKAFAAFASVGTSVELDVNGKRRGCWYFDRPPPTYGTKHLIAVIGNGSTERDLRERQLNFAFETIMTAMARTDLRCRAFTIGDYYDGRLTGSAFEFVSALAPELRLYFANVTKLHLYFGLSLPIDTTVHIGSLRDFGQTCANLQELHLGWNGYECDERKEQEALVVIGGAFTSRHLHNIRLVALCSNVEGYIHFLDAHVDCLTTLTLDNALIPVTQCWSTVLRWMLQSARLESLVLDSIAQNHPYAVMNVDDTDQRERFVLEGGAEEVKEQLRMMLPKVCYNLYD